MSESADDAFVNQLKVQAQIESLRTDISLRIRQRNEVALNELLQQSRKAHHESKKTTLKSDVKKTSMFVNKLRSMNSEGLTQCIRDVETLNLTLYISEIVNAILEISFKPTDVPFIVKLITALHKRYEDFSSMLLDRLKNAVITPISTNEDKDGSVQKKRRIQIRLLIELYESGVFLEESFFSGLLKLLIGKTKVTESNTKRQVDLMGISTFIKYGSETLLGLPPKSIKILAREAGMDVSQLPVFLIVNPVLAHEMRGNVSEIYSQVCNELVKAFTDFKKKEKRCENDRLIYGSLSEQKQTELENAKKLYERLMGVVTGIAESLGEDIPVLEEEKDEETSTGDPSSPKGISIWDASNTNTGDYNGPFGDLESRSFYEDLPDLLAMVPLTLLGLTSEQADALREQWRIAKESRYIGPPANLISISSNPNNESNEVSIPSSSSSSSSSLSPSSETQDVDTESNSVDPDENHHNQNSNNNNSSFTSSGSSDNLVDTDNSISSSTITDNVEDTPHARIMLLIQDKLPDCTNKQKCDEFCQNFCFLNSKIARRKLAQALVKVPWGRGELVSTYARIIASLHRVFNDIAPVVLESLQKELTFITKTKGLLSSNQVDSKSRILRYLGELIKFGVAPPIMVLKPMKAFLADFSSHNVDFLAALLEACGRFLLMLPYTHDRMEIILETMLRLRRSKYLDLRQQTLVDSAYFAVRPPDRNKNVKKELTIVQKYISYLLIDRLCSKNANVDNIITSIRRLPFANPDENVEYYIIKYSLRIARQKYTSIGILADFFSGILKHKPYLVIKLVDTLYEEIFRGFDSPYKSDHQRMIGYIRLMGELYNYAVLSSAIIFELLYTLIHYGHSKEQLSDGTSSNNNSGNSGSSNSSSSSSSSGNTTGMISSYTSNSYSQLINAAIARGDISINDTTITGTSTNTATTTASVHDNNNSNNTSNTKTSTTVTSTTTTIKSKEDQVIEALMQIRHDPCRYDPKIVSDIDPVYDLFRAQLVVELINTCGEYYTKGQAKDKLNRFLMYFQRYLLCKQAIPLHVEFSILDMFDTLENHAKSVNEDNNNNDNNNNSNNSKNSKNNKNNNNKNNNNNNKTKDSNSSSGTVFTRYYSMEEIQPIIDAIEIRNKESTYGLPSEFEEQDVDDDSGDDDEDETSVRRSEKPGESEDVSEGESSGVDDQDEDEDSDEDDSLSQLELAKLMEKTKLAEAEDDEFEKAFRSVMMDSIASASKGIGTKSNDADRMAIPAVLPRPKNILKPIHNHSSYSTTSTLQNTDNQVAKSEPSNPNGGVVFKMLSRDTKGRVETRQVLVPESNAIVVKLQKSEEALRLERQKIKEKVLLLESMHAATVGDDEDYNDDPENYSFGTGIPYTNSNVFNSTGRGRGRGSRGGRGDSTYNSHSSSSSFSSSSSSASGLMRSGQYARRGDEFQGKKVMDTLNLDEFLAESSASEIRRLQSSMTNNTAGNQRHSNR